MQLNAVKTTLTFTPSFAQRLKAAAQERHRSMSRLVEDELEAIFQKREERQLARMYAAIRKWQGTGSPGITDASQTIDEVLYGENGAWKGESAE